MTTQSEENSLEDPFTYYNTACIYSLFKDIDDAKKYFTWCFNHKDGEFKGHRLWAPRKLDSLVAAAKGDADLANIRKEPWFNQILEDYVAMVKRESESKNN